MKIDMVKNPSKSDLYVKRTVLEVVFCYKVCIETSVRK